MKSVKKSIDKRALHKREYDSRVNERQMQTTEEKVDTSKALDASLVDTKSNGTESGKQDTRSNSGNAADTDDADIKPVYDEEPMVEVNKVRGTSINFQEEQNLDLRLGTPFNLKKDRIKAWIKENVIYGRPRLHGIALIQEISARQNSHGILSLLTS
ncbi:hypothetical protein Tco_0454053 [Tanacetum coccineum]